jgi:biofilm PGA synthesis N-glycosyltransferase PgaC
MIDRKPAPSTTVDWVVDPRRGVDPRILIISPVRNEAAHIDLVVRSVAAQELAPARWLVVDDNSDDDTLQILRRLEGEVPFLEVLESGAVPEDVPDRLARAAAPRTFNKGLRWAGDLHSYTHIMKLDGDIELRPSYFRALLAHFDEDPHLGLAGGVLDEPVEGGGWRRVQIPPVHVHGALKLYSRECFRAIGGVQNRLGWDTIDETYARMRGFKTKSFPELVAIHHRPLGSADGTLRGHARHGECAYIAHFTPTWVALRAVKVGRRRPVGLSGIAFFFGYLRAACRRVERVADTEYRQFTHAELRRRLLDMVLPRQFVRRT